MLHPHFKWKLRWSLLILFLLAVATSSLAIITFTYERLYPEVLEHASTRMEIIGNAMLRTIRATTNEAVLVAKLTRGTIISEADISKNNPRLVSYLLRAMDSAPEIESIRIGAKNGNLISITDVARIGQEKDIPNGTKYKIQILDRTGPSPEETVEFSDPDGTILQKRENPGIPMDPRSQPWYRIVATWPHLRWGSEFSSFQNQIVANLSLPITDVNDTVVAVASMDISLNALSNIASFEKVRKSGKVYIFNQVGEVVAPSSADLHSPLLKEAQIHFRETEETTFTLQEKGVTWLINCSLLPLDYETDWLIVTAVPFDDFWSPMRKVKRDTVLITLLILLAFAIPSHLIARTLSKPLLQIARQCDQLQRLDFQKPDPIHSRVSEIVTLATSFDAMYSALKSFARYVPRKVITMLNEQRKEIGMGGQKGELTLLKSNINHFTETAKILPHEALLSSLSGYFEALSKVIVDSEGSIDSYSGDSMMAFWNAPIPIADSSTKACLAALRCLDFPKDQKLNNPFLNSTTRFAIHNGEMIFGNIGSPEKMSYTAIGNAVHIVEHLLVLNKQYSTRILISETVLKKLGPEFVTRPLDVVHDTDLGKKITVYELAGRIDETASPDDIALCRDFTVAFMQFQEGKKEEALQNLIALNQRFPSDVATKVWLDKVSEAREKK